MRRSALAAGLLTLAALPGAAARAHDFWLEPSTFRPVAGDTVAVRLRVGEDFLGDPVLRASSSIERFVVRERGREDDVPGVEGGDPAGWFRAREGAAVGSGNWPFDSARGGDLMVSRGTGSWGCSR